MTNQDHATVRSEWGMACPKCGQDDAMQVKVGTYVYLTPHGTDGYSDHEWDRESDVMCDCGWTGKAGDAHLDEAKGAIVTQGDETVRIEVIEKSPEKTDMALEGSQPRAGEQVMVLGTPDPKTEDSANQAQAEDALRRFYVTMTWDDWPEGGSYGTVVFAKDYEQAEKLCRDEMENCRVDPGASDEENHPHPFRDEWHLVDCFDLDEFIAGHQRPIPAPAPEPIERVDFKCGNCGSVDVVRDAWAEWNTAMQMWEISGEVFDHAHCRNCDGETKLETVILTRSA